MWCHRWAEKWIVAKSKMADRKYFDYAFRKSIPKYVTVIKIFENNIQWAFRWILRAAYIITLLAVYNLDCIFYLNAEWGKSIKISFPQLEFENFSLNFHSWERYRMKVFIKYKSETNY